MTLERWLGAFDTEDFEAQPQLALLGTWVFGITGRGDDAIRLAEVAERASRSTAWSAATAWSFESRRAMARAVLCRRGPRAMLADAELAVAREPASGRWLTHALWLLGSAHYLLGDLDAAEAALHASTREAMAIDSPNLAPLTLLASIRLRRQDWAGAELLVREASGRMEQFGYGYLVMSLGRVRAGGAYRRPPGRGACRPRGAGQGAARPAARRPRIADLLRRKPGRARSRLPRDVRPGRRADRRARGRGDRPPNARRSAS